MRRLALSLVVAIASGTLLAACSDGDKTPEQQDTVDTGPDGPTDQDRDGFTSDEDCDDTDANVHPSADEICDGVDNDCDLVVDEDVERTYYEDGDGDGFGDTDAPVTGCTAPSGSVPIGNDCDDDDASAYPGGVEVCDGADNNCDGEVDEDEEATWYADADGDGFGDPDSAIETCEPPEGYVADATDCDDTRADAYPGATELCDGVDNDCDGEYDEDESFDVETFYEDRDEDGFGDPSRTTEACSAPEGYVADATDCDDLDPEAWPGAEETCDGEDDDCDDEVDEDGVDAPTWYGDGDGDGYGDAATTAASCSAPEGYVADGEDCDDADLEVHPGAEETCDGVDQDCDGTADDGATDAPEWYADGDGDGYGDVSVSTASCEAPDGYVADATDCDDEARFVYPGADEWCNDLDDDCDGEVDEDTSDTLVFYQDRDEDGFGDLDRTTTGCAPPDGYVGDGTDCDDLDADSYPGADETCDGEDDDCDGLVDDDAVDGDPWYADGDADGYGDAAATTTACDAPDGYTADGTDCDDADEGVHPGASEVCDDVDQDCDGSVDEGATDADTWYADRDLDGYGDPDRSREACEAPIGYSEDGSDCDDGDGEIHPGADEVCDGADNDCDGSADESGSTDAGVWYQDRDEDGFGDPGRSTVACDAPAGYVADGTDCDDLDSGSYPGADERCDGADNDCDGSTDEGATDAATWYADADDDGYGDASASTSSCDAPAGYSRDDTDCDDADASVHPGADETCNDTDDDCDGSTDEGATDASAWYADGDGDTYGDPSDEVRSCEAPSGYVSTRTDCDDTDGDIHPGADEVCDAVDNDCDGSADESSAVDAPTWHQDRDEDGFGDPSRSTASCSTPAGYVADDTDCDDLDSGSYPGADEVCDGADNDCDGSTDEGATDAVIWYADVDDDGYGDVDASTTSCEAPSGYGADATDCDDAAASVHPGADETCNDTDDDCDGSTDEGATDASAWYADGDGDSYGDPSDEVLSCEAPSGYVSTRTDCDDTDGDIHPGADEVCDAVDNDCDGSADESSAVDAPTWHQDRDEDGYGDPSRTTVSCSTPTGYVSDGTDCDDLDDRANPGLDEVCDDVDNDCDGATDEGATDAVSWYADVDADGYGDVDASTTSCEAPSGYGADATDCDDAAASVHPGADETCNDTDDDCDGSTDEGATDASTWYADADSDGYGTSATSTESCDRPSGYVSSATDCDDGAAAVNPAADEVCDDIDNDCDGLTDDSSASDISTWYADRDADGYGDSTRSTTSCDTPADHVRDSTDCDDTDSARHPGYTEICDDKDNDCDGTVDDSATDSTRWYPDSDSDGYGSSSSSGTLACDRPTGYVSDNTDCDDAHSSCHPGGTEICDDLDNDCDGSADEAGSYGTTSYYPDDDGDGYGDEAGAAVAACDPPTGYVSDATDCDDADVDVNPGETEYCDGTDNDCSGDEDQIVTFTNASGTRSDVSSTWNSGSDGAAKSISATTIGTYTVCSGVYYVSVTSSATSLTIKGLNGSSETILSGGGSKRTLSATRALGLSGLTVMDGYTSTGNGGNLSTTSTLSASDVVFENGSAVRGGNVYISGASATFDTVEINGGVATYGGGLYMTGGVLSGDTLFLSDGDATYGGCAYLASATTATLADSDISLCNASSYGGGVYVGGSSTLTMTGTDISDNTGGDYGGGVYLSASTLTMSSGSNIDSNTASLLGGGLYLTGTSSFSCTGSSTATAGVWGNTALVAGGAYMTTSDSIRSTTCDWTASKDNDLYDIVVGLVLYYSKGNNATFTCGATGC